MVYFGGFFPKLGFSRGFLCYSLILPFMYVTLPCVCLIRMSVIQQTFKYKKIRIRRDKKRRIRRDMNRRIRWSHFPAGVRGGTHLLGGKGVGDQYFGRRQTQLCTLHMYSKYFVDFIYFWRPNKKQRSCDGRGGGAQRPVWGGNELKKTGARSARARTRGQNPLVQYVCISTPG
jgi:hypothetical protein